MKFPAIRRSKSLDSILEESPEPSVRNTLTETPRYLRNSPSPSTPCERWSLGLDEKHFREIREWNSQNPPSMFMTRLRKALDRHEPLLGAIMDAPLPYRGLATALLHVIKLTIDIVGARHAAVRFVLNVFDWVAIIAACFKESDTGYFANASWDNLSGLRSVIEDACSWAHGMVGKSKWLERYSVKEKIEEYNNQFNEAVKQFAMASQINAAHAHDSIMHELRNIKGSIEGSLTKDNPHKILEHLNPTYHGQKKAPCDLETRQKVLKDITDWSSNISEGSPSLLWLTGDPGVGKSAISASTAKSCEKEGTLWAQFFINRNDAPTTDPEVYFPSIFQQISNHLHSIPDAGYAKDSMKWDLSKELLEQALNKFPKILQLASAACPNKAIVIVIDALDEADIRSLQKTAETFANILVDLPMNVKVFISSRVEDPIKEKFNDIQTRTTNIHISTESSIKDVASFLKTQIRQIIKKELRLDEDSELWDGGLVEKLSGRASGLFIWAVTAIKYIQARIESSGKNCLSTLSNVLDELDNTEMEDIDKLYLDILRHYLPQDHSNPSNKWKLLRFRRVVGAIICQRSPLSISSLEKLLDSESQNPAMDRAFDIQRIVQLFRTVLVNGLEEVSAETIPRVHKSFADFITSPKAKEFCILLDEVHGELALHCLRQIKLHWTEEQWRPLEYATAHLTKHLDRMSTIGIPNKTMAKFRYEDLQDNSFPKVLSPGWKNGTLWHIRNWKPNTITFISQTDLNYDFLQPRRRGLASPNASGQVWGAGASASWNGLAVLTWNRDLAIRIWSCHLAKPISDPHPDTWEWEWVCDSSIYNFTSPINFARLSYDITHVVSAHDDGTIAVWNIQTRKSHTVLKVAPSRLLCAFFSFTGQYILACTTTYIISVWDWKRGIKLDECSGVLGFTQPGLSSHIAIPHYDNLSETQAQSKFFSYRVGKSAYLARPPDGPWFYCNADQNFFMVHHPWKIDIYGFPSSNPEEPSTVPFATGVLPRVFGMEKGSQMCIGDFDARKAEIPSLGPQTWHQQSSVFWEILEDESEVVKLAITYEVGTGCFDGSPGGCVQTSTDIPEGEEEEALEEEWDTI